MLVAFGFESPEIWAKWVDDQVSGVEIVELLLEGALEALDRWRGLGLPRVPTAWQALHIAAGHGQRHEQLSKITYTLSLGPVHTKQRYRMGSTCSSRSSRRRAIVVPGLDISRVSGAIGIGILPPRPCIATAFAS